MSDDFGIEAFTLLSLAVVIIGVRTGARLSMVGVRNFQLDDYLMPLAAVVYGLETGAAYCVGAKWMGLANNSMTDAQRKALTPESPEYWLRVEALRRRSWVGRCTPSCCGCSRLACRCSIPV